MRATKALLIVFVILVVTFAAYLGVAWYVRDVRAGPVNGWIRSAKGFGPAKSPEDALDKFRQAIEKRDYDAAAQYLGGDYREWFDKALEDAESLAREIDNLKAAMKKHGVKSDRGLFVLFALDPFPGGFKYDVAKGSGDSIAATINWKDELLNHQSQAIQGWQVDNRAWNALLPFALDTRSAVPLQVTVKKESNGTWLIHFPVSSGTTANARHLRETVDFLRKNGSNFKNALQGLKNDVKNEPQTKENFESALKTKLEQSK